MRHRRPWVASIPVVLGLVLLVGCASEKAPSEKAAAYEPVTVKPIPGTHLDRITLAPGAARRLDVRTARAVTANGQIVIPGGAVLFEPNGDAFVLISPDRLSFVKEDVEIDHFDGDIAVVSSGVRPGTNVVTLGAAELYGAEAGLGTGEEEEEE